VSLLKSGLRPPPKPDHVADEIVTITAADIGQLALEAGLPVVAERDAWDEIADQLTSAFVGYAAGSQREASNPANVPLRDWGAALANDAANLLVTIGFDQNSADPRLDTWRTTWLAAEALTHSPDASATMSAAFAELELHLRGVAKPNAGETVSLNADDVNILLQRAIFRLIPTLQVLARAGHAIEQQYGSRTKRGGSARNRSIRWAFEEIVAAFRALFQLMPQISPPGGRYRHDDGIHLLWFRRLMELVERRVDGVCGAEAEVIRALAHKALDVQIADKNYDRLRAWVFEAAGKG